MNFDYELTRPGPSGHGGLTEDQELLVDLFRTQLQAMNDGEITEFTFIVKDGDRED